MDNLKQLYIETDSLELAESCRTGWLRIIAGDAIDVDVRAGQYKGKRRQIFFARFSILGRDHQIHAELKRPFRSHEVRYVKPTDDVQSVEAFDIKVDPQWSDDEKKLHVTNYIGKIVEAVGGSVEVSEFIPTTWQRKAIEFIAQRWGEGKQTLVMELAARFGKTGTYLTLLDYSDAQVMVVANYFKSVNTSFAQTINSCFRDRIRWVNVGDATFESDLREALDGGHKVVIGAALHDKARLTDRINLIRSIEKRFVVVDEADFGAHTKSQFAKVQSLREGCPLILTTGTNAERAVADHKVDASLSITYFDMLTMAQGQLTN
jgi:hypothetical protein